MSVRTPEALLSVVVSFELETNPKYLKRDVTGDGAAETFCNIAISDMTAALDAPIPNMLANSQARWLENEGHKHGWMPCSKIEALGFASGGYPTVVTSENPGGHGHIALCVPSLTDSRLHIAQAGNRNFSNQPLEVGFGRRPVKFWSHS